MTFILMELCGQQRMTLSKTAAVTAEPGVGETKQGVISSPLINTKHPITFEVQIRSGRRRMVGSIYVKRRLDQEAACHLTSTCPWWLPSSVLNLATTGAPRFAPSHCGSLPSASTGGGCPLHLEATCAAREGAPELCLQQGWLPETAGPTEEPFPNRKVRGRELTSGLRKGRREGGASVLWIPTPSPGACSTQCRENPLGLSKGSVISCNRQQARRIH